MKSNFADIPNIGSKGAPAPSPPPASWPRFTKAYKWAHSTSPAPPGSPAREGATGRPVPLLTEFLIGAPARPPTAPHDRVCLYQTPPTACGSPACSPAKAHGGGGSWCFAPRRRMARQFDQMLWTFQPWPLSSPCGGNLALAPNPHRDRQRVRGPAHDDVLINLATNLPGGLRALPPGDRRRRPHRPGAPGRPHACRAYQGPRPPRLTPTERRMTEAPKAELEIPSKTKRRPAPKADASASAASFAIESELDDLPCSPRGRPDRRPLGPARKPLRRRAASLATRHRPPLTERPNRPPVPGGLGLAPAAHPGPGWPPSCPSSSPRAGRDWPNACDQPPPPLQACAHPAA